MKTKPNYRAISFSMTVAIAFLTFWMTHLKPPIIDRSSLVNVSGTLKKTPQYEVGSGGDPGAVFELHQYDNTIFGIPSGLYEVLDKKIFEESKLNDSVFFLVEKSVYQKRLNPIQTNNFLTNFPNGAHVRFYDLIFKKKNYLPLTSFNKKVADNNALKNIICAVLFLLICRQVYTDFRKLSLSQH